MMSMTNRIGLPISRDMAEALAEAMVEAVEEAVAEMEVMAET
jgi:hypothetical protein